MAYIKQNNFDSTTELWIDGKFVAAWNQLDLTDHELNVISGMLGKAFECGMETQLKLVREALGIKS